MGALYDFVVHGGQCLTKSGLVETDLGIRDGRIAEIGDLPPAKGAESFDASGLVVLPGVIDTQVHFREPGLTHKETIHHGSLGAILGGVTAFCEMPNTKPPTVNWDALSEKAAIAEKQSFCDFAFFAGASAENTADLPLLEKHPACAGVKIFIGSSTGTLLVEKDETIEAILRTTTRMIAVHGEDEARLRERRHLAVSEAHPRAHPLWRDARTVSLALERLMALAGKTGRALHILHISSADEVELLRNNKTAPITAEITPQHLSFAAPDCYERLGSLAQMNPPIREPFHQDALWDALRDGVFTTMGSDHAPHTVQEKNQPYPSSPSGLPGVQTLLPVMLDHVNRGRLSLGQLSSLTAEGPARLFHIEGKGRIARGFDADFALVDLGKTWRIDNRGIASVCGWTPWDGERVQGAVQATMLRGRLVMQEGQPIGTPQGRALRYKNLPVSSA